jgi:prefoldin subunit 5
VDIPTKRTVENLGLTPRRLLARIRELEAEVAELQRRVTAVERSFPGCL